MDSPGKADTNRLFHHNLVRIFSKQFPFPPRPAPRPAPRVDGGDIPGDAVR